MTISNALKQDTIDRLDAEVLLSYILKKDRSWLIAHSSDELTSIQKKEFDALVMRRKNHEPVAYITGEKEFYGRKFKVDPRVLIPRPATETLIDEVKNVLMYRYISTSTKSSITEADTDIAILTNTFPYKLQATSYKLETIIDVGTGSGCIGITLALEIPNIKIICTDISDDALEVAKENAKYHNVSDRIKFIKSDLLTSNELTKNEKRFFVVSNPPYIPSDAILEPDISNYEPKNALFAGSDGLEIISKLYKQCLEHPKCIGCALEMRLLQAKKITQQHPNSATLRTS